MSTLKTPQQKKLASLALDRRNVYGENDKASRKLIPRRKQEAQQATRRAAKQPLLAVESLIDEDTAHQAQFETQTALIQSKRNGFKKRADAPLREVLEAKSEPPVPVWRGGDTGGVLRELRNPRKRSIDRS